MKKLLVPAAAALLATTVAATTATAATQQFSSVQKQQIEAIIKDYIISHPEVLVEAGKTLQKQQMQKMLSHAQIAAVSQADKLVHDSVSPIVGNKAGKVTVIEFYDYQCAVCHEQAPIMEQLIKKYPHVRFIFRQLPIFGPASQYAAKVAIAAYHQGKFDAFNKKLFDAHLMEGQLTKKAVNDIAKAAGVSVPTKDDTHSEEIAKQYFTQGISLARALGFPGTPGLIIMPTNAHPDSDKVTVFLGYSGLHPLEEAIKKAQ
ncbi:MAG: thioredoxin domain-containing protein [Gammaproteobacteria bacterium]|nr:thioredoxin domain-containing protein [Gammaproteobacteria bacterium]